MSKHIYHLVAFLSLSGAAYAQFNAWAIASVIITWIACDRALEWWTAKHTLLDDHAKRLKVLEAWQETNTKRLNAMSQYGIRK